MCILPTTLIKKPSKKIRTAWKCISVHSTKLTWEPLVKEGRFDRERWAVTFAPVGFNCYTTKKAALKSGWSTSNQPVRVRVRRVYGYNRKEKVLFAWEIYVPKPLKNGL